MIDFFDEINSLNSILLIDIKEPADNQVIINIIETTVSDKEEYISVGEKSIGPVKRVITNSDCRKYSLFFKSYVAYMVVNESFPIWHDNEQWVGKILRVYSKSNYLDFIRKDTSAEEFHNYHNETLNHFYIGCENHIIHVASIDEPIITRIFN